MSGQAQGPGCPSGSGPACPAHGLAHGLAPAAPGHRGALWWRFDAPRTAISSASVGGGVGPVGWVLNIGVERGYRRTDLATHAAEVAAPLSLAGPGSALFTAVPVERVEQVTRDDVHAWCTVGVTRPTWPADEAALRTAGRRTPGTVNCVVVLPVRLAPAALVQVALSVGEAKAQACVESGLPGTGTASDALVVVTGTAGTIEPFGGVRSTWGARAALAVHAAVRSGLESHP